MRCLGVLGATTLLFLQDAKCNMFTSPVLDERETIRFANDPTNIDVRDEASEGGVVTLEGVVFPRDAVAQGKVILKESSKRNRSTSNSVALDGRALISKWLNPHGLSKRTCTTLGYPALCADGGCCPASNLCCDNNNGYCKYTSGDVCCSYGTCDAGYVCDSLCGCISSGGTCCPNGSFCDAGYQCCGSKCAPSDDICCSDGSACYAGNICVTSLDYGWTNCCTDSTCTAYVKAGVTITLAAPTPTHTIPPPVITDTPVVYEYYYLTLTWSYYFYFFTYYYQIELTTLTSTYVTTTTTLSVYETDSLDAAASLTSLGISVQQTDFTTPAQATTALAQSADVIRSTASSSSTSDETLPTTQGGGQGDISGAGTQASVPGWSVMWALGAGVVALAGGMVWL